MMRNGQLPTQVKQSPTQTDEWGTMPTDTAQCVSMAGKRCTEPKGTWTQAAKHCTQQRVTASCSPSTTHP